MLKQVDAHGLGGDLVVPYGLEGPAVGGIHQHHDDGDAQAGYRKGEEHAGEGGEAAQQVGAVGDGPQGVPLEEGPDDLRKAQRGDGQVIAFEPQHRQADQEGEEGGRQARQDQGHRHGQGKLDQAPVKVLVYRVPGLGGDGEDAVGIGADQHKARLAQGKQAGKAVEQVHGDRHQGVDGALFEHHKQHGGGVHHLLQHIQHHKQGHDQAGGDEICRFFLHDGTSLRPYPWTFRQIGRWAWR